MFLRPAYTRLSNALPSKITGKDTIYFFTEKVYMWKFVSILESFVTKIFHMYNTYLFVCINLQDLSFIQFSIQIQVL